MQDQAFRLGGLSPKQVSRRQIWALTDGLNIVMASYLSPDPPDQTEHAEAELAVMSLTLEHPGPELPMQN